MTTWKISNQHIELEVQSLGGMLGPAKVFLRDRVVYPLAVAPWSDDAEALNLPPILQRLRGEWPCIPFGITKPVSSFPAHWQNTDTSLDALVDNDLAHGYSSNRHWYCENQTEQSLTLAIDYPENFPVKKLQRHICLAPETSRIDISLSVETRQDCSLPIGLHPVLALSAGIGQSELCAGAYRFGRTYPVQFEPSSCLAIDQRFIDLSRVPQYDGSSIDLTRLPLSEAREELVQIYGVEGKFTLLEHEQKYAVDLEWNPQHFPSCVLWFSQRGRDAYPWSGRHIALGVEPTCSCFDLNPSLAALQTSPLAQEGVKTLQAFRAGEEWMTQYSLTIREI